MPNIKSKFPTYDAFGRASLAEVYGDALEKAVHFEAKTFASVYIENLGNGEFKVSQLPIQAQYSSVFGIIAEDFDSDGHTDILLAGNFYPLEVETGRNDAGTGLLLKGDGTGQFAPVTALESGFFAPGDVRDIQSLRSKGRNLVAVANNQGKIQIFVGPRKKTL